jgi:histidyl-tRNA synthetase
MSSQQITPSILPGFMELLPREQLVFNKMLATVKESFELYGCIPMDTPIIEKAEILNAKGGEESEKQLYAFKKGDNDLALRFDLTVPLARYVAQHFNDIHFPFRRYQIGKVYRGEKPQKGRFREFYQCDVDVIGNEKLDLFHDSEVLAVIDQTFTKLGIGKFLIKINNRKILTGFIQELNLASKSKEFLRAIDKLDKLGLEKVRLELDQLGLKKEQIQIVEQLVNIQGDPQSVLSQLEYLSVRNDTFVTGLAELAEVTKHIQKLNVPKDNWTIDLKIARGLDYYTGTVYETFLTEHIDIGSICSGGRYEDLANYFTERKLPGVGISIGLTRLFDQLLDLGIVEGKNYTPSKVLIVPVEDTLDYCLNYANLLRSKNIACEVYNDSSTSMRKKLDYANKINVPYVAIIGENEIKDDSVTIKNMTSGEQSTLSFVKSLELI